MEDVKDELTKRNELKMGKWKLKWWGEMMAAAGYLHHGEGRGRADAIGEGERGETSFFCASLSGSFFSKKKTWQYLVRLSCYNI
jgi:hypothetical protein